MTTSRSSIPQRNAHGFNALNGVHNPLAFNALNRASSRHWEFEFISTPNQCASHGATAKAPTRQRRAMLSEARSSR